MITSQLILLKSDFFTHGQQVITVTDRYSQDVLIEHTREFCGLVMVQRGNGLHVLNDRPYRITRGDLFYIRAGNKHSCTFVNDPVLQSIICCLERLALNVGWQGAIPGFDGTSRQPYRRPGGVGMTQARQVINQLEHESSQRDAQAFIMAELLFGQLVTHLKRHRYVTDTLLAAPNGTLLDELIAALAGSHEHASELDTFCKREQCSEHALCQQFRSQTGMTTNQYLRQVRVCYTQYLLKRSRLMISETSMHCDFKDSNYFSAVFTREAGVTSSQWRHLSTQHV